MTKAYGWLPQLPDHRDRPFKRLLAASQLPVEVDLRYDGHMPAVYDQGQLGSCTANAACGAMEYMSAKQGLPMVVPSRLFAYYNARSLEGHTATDSGAQIRDAIKAVNAQGVCPESDWPYDPWAFATQPPPNCYAEALQDRAITYEAVGQDPELLGLRSALAQGFPVVFGITVYPSFESASVAADAMVPLPGPDEAPIGGHAILAVGYFDATQHVVFRNSWGPDWGTQQPGKGGYGFIPYAYLANPNLSRDWWAIEVTGK